MALSGRLYSSIHLLESIKKPWAVLNAHGWYSKYYVGFKFYRSSKKGIVSPWANVAEGRERMPGK
jgi:hypothetical protein